MCGLKCSHVPEQTAGCGTPKRRYRSTVETYVEQRTEHQLENNPLQERLRQPAGRRIGFVSTRLAGTDGVSLEARKWAQVLDTLGHECFYFASAIDQEPTRCHSVAEAAFDHPAVDTISILAFSRRSGDPEYREFTNLEISDVNTGPHADLLRPPAVTRRVHELSEHLKDELYGFVRAYDLELLIVENALSIPMNLALGVALTELIAETGLPTIAHHHDFYWERKRFHGNCVADYLDMAFPPRLPSIRHVVINSVAAEQLAWRKGLASVLIPNVMDFERPPPDGLTDGLREALGLTSDELLILQPTRVVQRKGIEHAIELTRRLGRPARLVISHAIGDEGCEYARRIRDFAELLDVRVSFADALVGVERGSTGKGQYRFQLDDIYAQADLVTYPSLEEGFGNAFLEAIYFQRPVALNNYLVYEVDIKPKGFRVIEFEDFITDGTVRQVQQVLADPALARTMAETNFELGRRYFSYGTLARRLQTVIADLFGDA
jgi:glycosyltransferase involved in cell wall biosynthesis